jgi:transcriptional regulator with XRE-family HTH domain
VVNTYRKTFSIIRGVVIKVFNSIGGRLKELVKEKGLEQQEVAALLKMNAATFNGYVSNKRVPSIEKLKIFAEYFGVSVDYLVGYTEIKAPFLSHMTDKMKAFVNEPKNIMYLELAMDIEAKTVVTK